MIISSERYSVYMGRYHRMALYSVISKCYTESTLCSFPPPHKYTKNIIILVYSWAFIEGIGVEDFIDIVRHGSP